VLIGRRLELDRLDAVLDAATAGRGGALVLRGQAGMGKTSLLHEATSRFAGRRVLTATGNEAERCIAYGGLITLLGPVRTLLGLLAPPHERVLRVALRLEDSALPLDPASVGVALGALIEVLAGGGPALVVVDDLQWLDASSAMALTFVARRLSGVAAAIVLALRTGEGGAEGDVEIVGLPVVEVAELSRGDVDAWAAQHGLPSEVASASWRIAGGHPLALAELWRDLDDDQRAGRAPLDPRRALAGGIRQSLLDRVCALPEPTRRALAVVALSGLDGEAFFAGALRAVGLHLADLDAAIDGNVIDRRGGVLRFCHPLMRGAVLSTTGVSRQRDVHRALADVCTTHAEVERATWHRAAASTSFDDEVADALVAVAGSSRRRGALREAAAAMLEAARLRHDQSIAGTSVNAAAADRWMAGDVEGTLRLADDGRGLSDPRVRAGRALVVGQAEVWTGDMVAGIDRMQRAAHDVEACDPALAATCLAIASSFVAFDHIEHATRLSAAAVERAERTSDVAALVLANAVHGWHQLLSGHVEPAAARLAPVVQLAPVAVQMGADHVHLSQLVAIHHVVTERWDEADELLATIADTARDHGWVGALALATGTEAALAFRRGDLRRAYALGSRELLGDALAPIPSGWAKALRAQIAAALGDDEQTLALAAQAEEHARRFALPVLSAWAGHALGHLALSHDDAVTALRHLARTDLEFDSRGLREPGLVGWQADHIEALVRTGRRHQAAAAIERLADAAEATGRAWAHGVVCRSRALLAAGDEQAHWFEEALRWHDKLEVPLERARTLLCRGRASAQARGHGRDDLNAALHLFERHGAMRWAGLTESLLDAHAPVAHHAVPSAVLSAAEHRVADAIGRGLTNREAASALFVSPKTVDFHLHNIFRKLDVRSRTELAVRMALSN